MTISAKDWTEWNKTVRDPSRADFEEWIRGTKVTAAYNLTRNDDADGNPLYANQVTQQIWCGWYARHVTFTRQDATKRLAQLNELATATRSSKLESALQQWIIGTLCFMAFDGWRVLAAYVVCGALVTLGTLAINRSRKV